MCTCAWRWVHIRGHSSTAHAADCYTNEMPIYIRIIISVTHISAHSCACILYTRHLSLLHNIRIALLTLACNVGMIQFT